MTDPLDCLMVNKRLYCTFIPPLLLLMTHHERKAAESFTVALTLTLGGWGRRCKSAIVPNNKKYIHLIFVCLFFFIHSFFYFFRQYSRCLVFKERKIKDMFKCGVSSVITFNFVIVVNLLS